MVQLQLLQTLRATKVIKLTGISGTFAVDEKITQSSTVLLVKLSNLILQTQLLYYVQTRHNDEGVDSK